MYSDSVLYTVGTALNRAQSNGTPVQVLVEGQWLSGQVAAVDGHGVVLTSDDRRARRDPDGQRLGGADVRRGPEQPAIPHPDRRRRDADAVVVLVGLLSVRSGRQAATAAATRSSVAVNATRTCSAPAGP